MWSNVQRKRRFSDDKLNETRKHQSRSQEPSGNLRSEQFSKSQHHRPRTASKNEDCEMLEVSRLRISPRTDSVNTKSTMHMHSATECAIKDVQMPDRAEMVYDKFTQVPKPKARFTMGFRSDCEKCLMKIPGHYNHWSPG